MKFPVRRCRKAALVMTLLASLTICSAASFLPKTPVSSTYAAQTVTLLADHRNAPNLSEEEPQETEVPGIPVPRSEAGAEVLLPTIHAETWLEEGLHVDYGITLEAAPVYVQADVQSEEMTRLEPGVILELVSAAGPLWYQVAWGETLGYISADSIIPNVSADATLESLLHQEMLCAEVTIPELSLRAEADSQGASLLILKLGQTVQLLSEEGEWSYVEYDGQLGYMLTEYLAPGAEKPQWVLDREATQRKAFTESLLAFAKEYLGCPYRYGKAGPSSFDCSGFTTYVFRRMGISLMRTAADQRLKSGTPVEGELQPGDLVFFSNSSYKAASHVGIYLGDGQFIHASSGGGTVTINNLTDPWYEDTYVGANRVY